MATDLQSQLYSIDSSLTLRPEQADVTRIVPVLVPASFFANGKWPGPRLRLRARQIGLTWAAVLPHQPIRYVDFEMANYWERSGIEWQEAAIENLAENSGEEAGTHYLCREDGHPYAAALMHADGMGPSRLLLRERLDELFPGGYQIAVPDMSCAFAFAIGLEKKELTTVENLVSACYQNGPRPLSPEIHAADDLLPDWNA